MAVWPKRNSVGGTMRKVLPIFFCVISVLGMLLFTFYDTSNYPIPTEQIRSYIDSSEFRNIYRPVVFFAFLIFIGLVIYEARIITTSDFLATTEKLNNTKKNCILVLAIFYVVLNSIAIIGLTIDAVKVGEEVAATPHYSEDYYVTMRRYEVIKVITYVVYEIATIVPLVLAIFIRIDKALSKNNKIVVIVATVFASLMGSCWALNAVDRLFDVRSLTRGNTQILPVNFVVVLLMLIITVVVTSMKKNQIKFKWFIAIFVMLIILNVPFISIKWNSLTEIHLPIMSNAYVHYLSEFEITDSEVAEINNDIKIIESMRVYSEKNMPI